ncbi:LysM peptidoglycan-binding domain-containing protein [Faecalicatena contorta]|uniref:LysM peptidoglycan-binding domain-containing protein n=1 Tax=Faecalicatena contorta TaxID=39482 RepID=UPI001F1FA23C|nr:LysM domain-containing protein [Faecalicatena contorta]MCF2555699.1 LysM peptidoglycan-binding domain-containing protein [Faecalicatena contorta]
MERQFPKNVRQIGNVSDEPKIYVEDYVDTYLNQLRTKAATEAAGAVLTGEITEQEGQPVVYICGALQIKGIEVKGTEIVIGEDAQQTFEEERAQYFPDSQIVGWCLIETGHPMSLNRGAVKVHNKWFAEENTIFIWKDAVERDEMFFAYKYGDLMQMGGHYIFYEKNPAMQNYMIDTRRQNGVTPSEMVEDRAAKDFRSTIREKIEYKEQRQNSRLLYVTSVLLVVMVLAIGISTMNNFDKMEAVQSSIESLSQSVSGAESKTEEVKEETPKEPENEETFAGTVPDTSTIQEQLSEEDFYTVKKGDTLDSISIRLYGDSSHVEAICKMNGLSDGNLIFIGQKLLLP